MDKEIAEGLDIFYGRSDPEDSPRRTVLADVGGFTPIIDGIATQYGLVRAAVFGSVWRHCQMQNGVCQASLEKIGARLSLDRATVQRHVEALCVAGYLKDLTPELRNRPHTYADTGKAGLQVAVVGVAQNNTTVAQNNTGVAESTLKIVVKKQKETIARPKPARSPAELEVDRLIGVFTEVTGIVPPDCKTKSDFKEYNKLWREPFRELVRSADGASEHALRDALLKMNDEGWNVSSPNSCRKALAPIVGQLNKAIKNRQTAPADDFAGLIEYVERRDGRDTQQNG